MRVRSERRLTYAERVILGLLTEHNGHRLSYETMQARLGLSRTTCIAAIYRLESAKRLIRVRGQGRTPNCYYLGAGSPIHAELGVYEALAARLPC